MTKNQKLQMHVADTFALQRKWLRNLEAWLEERTVTPPSMPKLWVILLGQRYVAVAREAGLSRESLLSAFWRTAPAFDTY